MKRHWYKKTGSAYFITNTIVEWKNIFIFEPYIKIIINSWKHFKSNRNILFYAFVIMPSHLHYIVQPMDEQYGIIEMQRDFKKFTAKRILDGLKYELQNGVFAPVEFFKEKNITREKAPELITLFKLIGKYSGQSHKVWMSEEKPIEIHTEEILKQKMNYIHLNPVKAYFADKPENYPFSSARNFYFDDEMLFSIDTII